MNIKIKNKLESFNIKDTYVVTVNTMTGDADDYHSFCTYFKNTDKLKEYIIYCEVLGKQYQRGMSGYDTYNSLPFFEEYFMDDWFYNNYGGCDSFEGYHVTYFDKNSIEYKVDISLSRNDLEMIKGYGELK